MALSMNMSVTAFYLVLMVLCAVKTEEIYHSSIDTARLYGDSWQAQDDTRVARVPSYAMNCEKPDFHICEEPPNAVPPEATKVCNYRNLRYHEQVYRWVAGRGCLQFMRDILFVGGVNPFNLNNGCYYGNLFAPCLEMAKEDGTCACYPFDPGLEEVARAIRDALVDHAELRWEECFYIAADCCSHVMVQNYTDIYGEHYCDATFDGWGCWDAAPAGSVATDVCPDFAYANTRPSCNHFSRKTCFENGTWLVQTDYSTCSIRERMERRYYFHVGMLAFAIASCLPAIFVFFFYKRLRVTRVALHRNLLIAIVVRNILVIVMRVEIYIDEVSNPDDEGTVMSLNPTWCRAVSVMEKIAVNAIFVCMLVEGVYLHRLIVAVFRKKLNINILYGVGAVIAVAPVIAWAVLMSFIDDHSCWLIYSEGYIQWVLDVPRLCILLVNTLLFVDVLRVLLTKIRNSENVNQLSTTKATLFLMPIFGTQFLLTAFRPNTNICTAEETYYFITYVVEGLQGFIVALLYCYINKEVHNLVKATYRKTESAVVSRVRRDSNYRRTTLGFNSDRRMTYSTALDPKQMDEYGKDQYATVSPKLNVAEIVSIQTSERLADILEPVYEVVECGMINDGYDSLERSAYSESSAKPIVDHYSKTSSVADPKDWIRCVSSAASSVYENSLNESEVNYLENKFPNRIENALEEQRETDTINKNASGIYETNYLDNYFPSRSLEDDIKAQLEKDAIGERNTNIKSPESVQSSNDNTHDVSNNVKDRALQQINAELHNIPPNINNELQGEFNPLNIGNAKIDVINCNTDTVPQRNIKMENAYENTSNYTNEIEENINSDAETRNVAEHSDKDIETPEETNDELEDEYDDSMVDEIMQYFNNDVVLDPSVLSPNRKDDDKILFL